MGNVENTAAAVETEDQGENQFLPGEWHDWTGEGNHPQPGTLINFRVRGGAVRRCVLAATVSWCHYEMDEDVVQFAVSTDEDKAERDRVMLEVKVELERRVKELQEFVDSKFTPTMNESDEFCLAFPTLILGMATPGDDTFNALMVGGSIPFTRKIFRLMKEQIDPNPIAKVIESLVGRNQARDSEETTH